MRTSFLLSALPFFVLFLLSPCRAFSQEEKVVEVVKVEPAAETPPSGDESAVESTSSEKAAQTLANLSQAQRERLEAAELARTKWMGLLRNSQSVNDTIRAKEELDKIHEEIAEIYRGGTSSADEEKSEYDFKDTKERTIIYGPIGVVLKFTEWLLEKLYIWHSG